LTWRRPIVQVDEAATSRGLKIVSGLATIAALVLLGRLTVFMVDPSRVACSFVPSSDWEVRHSCLSAYFVATNAATEAPNVYADSLYTMPDDDPRTLRKPRMIGPFRIDVYEYPPTFLILPRALRVLVPDFTRFRMLWFGLNGGVVLFAMLPVARALGPAAGTRALLLSPLVWAALPTLSTLQKGNVQAMVIALSMLAMVLFERRRFAAGGTLLAYATASKLYPGLLAIFLLMRRQWRALAWTAALGVALVLLSVADIGLAPYRFFITHLPGLLGGEAFPAFRNPAAMAINFSIPGLVFKLKLFGVPGMNFAASKIVGWIYTIVAVWAVVVVSRRALRDGEKPAVWMAILILATLRSPFLPQAYAVFPPLWLLTLLAAARAPTAKTIGLALLAWLALNVFWPMDWKMDPRLLAVATLLPQTVTIALAVLALRRAPEPAAQNHASQTPRSTSTA
jgi:alpha-1,2-mannosyltransferase